MCGFVLIRVVTGGYEWLHHQDHSIYWTQWSIDLDELLIQNEWLNIGAIFIPRWHLLDIFRYAVTCGVAGPSLSSCSLLAPSLHSAIPLALKTSSNVAFIIMIITTTTININHPFKIIIASICRACQHLPAIMMMAGIFQNHHLTFIFSHLQCPCWCLEWSLNMELAGQTASRKQISNSGLAITLTDLWRSIYQCPKREKDFPAISRGKGNEYLASWQCIVQAYHSYMTFQPYKM